MYHHHFRAQGFNCEKQKWCRVLSKMWGNTNTVDSVWTEMACSPLHYLGGTRNTVTPLVWCYFQPEPPLKAGTEMSWAENERDITISSCCLVSVLVWIRAWVHHAGKYGWANYTPDLDLLRLVMDNVCVEQLETESSCLSLPFRDLTALVGQ